MMQVPRFLQIIIGEEDNMTTIDVSQLQDIFREISDLMDKNKDYLIELDSKSGDGDLGLSMSSGFQAIIESEAMEQENFKTFLMKAGMVINEAAPSSLGTIMFIGFVAAAKKLAEYKELYTEQVGEFFMSWALGVMEKTDSKQGEKTILDAVIPAGMVLLESDQDLKHAIVKAREASYDGMLATIHMQAVHGRAAYYKEKSIGNQDGGATVGMLMVKAFENYIVNIPE